MIAWQPSLSVFLALCALVLLGCVLWWIRRKPPSIFMFPLCAELQLKHSHTLRLSWQPPPWVVFWCFVGCGLAALLLSQRPYWTQQTASSSQGDSELWIIDLSASVSARLTRDQYSDLLKNKAKQLPPERTLHILTSNTLHPLPTTARDFKGLEDDFHKSQLKGSQLLRTLKDKLDTYDHVTIFTDGSPESWPAGLIQASLNTSSHLWHNIDFHLIIPQKPERENVFLSHLTTIAFDRQNQKISLKATLSRRMINPESPEMASSGTLKLTWIQPHLDGSSEPLTAETDYHFPKHLKDLTVSIGGILHAQSPSQHPPLKKHLIRLEIIPQTPDLISSDNLIIATVTDDHQIMMIGSSLGESTLTDPIHPHQTTLKILGFHPQRYEQWVQEAHDQTQIAFISVSDHHHHNLSEVCDRIHPSTTSLKQLIVIPTETHLSQLICRCAQKLMDLIHPLSCPQTLSQPEDLAHHLLDQGFKTILTTSSSSPPLLTNSTSNPVPAVLSKDLGDLWITIALWPLNPANHRQSLASHSHMMFITEKLLRSPGSRSSPQPSSVVITDAIADITNWLLEKHSSESAQIFQNVHKDESRLFKVQAHLTKSTPKRSPDDIKSMQIAQNTIPLIIIIILCGLMLIEVISQRKPSS